MTRKEDKLRPYRIDYFNVNQMKDTDLALVESVVVRAVTSEEAIYELLGKPETWKTDTRPLVVIRAYRFYKKLGAHKQDVFKSVEELFPANKAVEVMEVIENYRKYMRTTNDLGNTPAAQADMDAVAHLHDTTVATPTPTGHVTRLSDSSLYDEVCVNCGTTDASGGLDKPCPSAPAVVPTPTPDAAPISGPDSPATKAVVADLQGMLSHDAHEQAMDTFVPDINTTGITTPQLQAAVGTKEPFTVRMSDGKLGTLDPTATNAAVKAIADQKRCEGCGATHLPVDSDTHLCGYCAEIVQPDQAVGSEGRPPLVAPAPDANNAGLPVWTIFIPAAFFVAGFLYLFFIRHH